MEQLVLQVPVENVERMAVLESLVGQDQQESQDQGEDWDPQARGAHLVQPVPQDHLVHEVISF